MNRFLLLGRRCFAFFALFLFFCVPSPIWAQNAEDLPLDDPAAPALPLPNAASPAPHAHHDDEPLASDALSSPDAFLWQALYAGITVAALCSYLGLFVVARRMVFIGVALAEISSAGIALGILLGFSPLIGALAFMILGVALFSRRWAPRRVPPDAAIGVFYTLSTALGILLIAKSAQGESHMLTLLRGDVLAVYPHETLQMALVFAAIALVHTCFRKEFLLVSLDRDTASTLGFNAAGWDFLLFLTIGVAVSLSIRSVGVLLTATMLIVPAATAFLLVPRWKSAAITAPFLGILAVVVGLWLSLIGDFPASAVIVAVAFSLMAPALIWHSLGRRG
ncbi:MAG TPA: metal ABC transporter permease [Abditibacterium sp.]